MHEKISILRKQHLINERYTYGKIGAHGIQIVTEVKCSDQVLNENIDFNIYKSLYFSSILE